MVTSQAVVSGLGLTLGLSRQDLGFNFFVVCLLLPLFLSLLLLFHCDYYYYY